MYDPVTFSPCPYCFNAIRLAPYFPYIHSAHTNRTLWAHQQFREYARINNKHCSGPLGDSLLNGPHPREHVRCITVFVGASVIVSIELLLSLVRKRTMTDRENYTRAREWVRPMGIYAYEIRDPVLDVRKRAVSR